MTPELATYETWPQHDGSVLRYYANHRYELGYELTEVPNSAHFAPIPSVTQILRPINDVFYGTGLGNGTSDALAHAAERGQAVHEACWYFDQDDLDDGDLDPEIVPYVAAYRKFRAENEIDIIEIERPRVGGITIKYAGRPDRIVRMKDRRGRWSLPSPLDIKTVETMAPATGVQLAAYCDTIPEAEKAGPEPRRHLWALQLKPDETYELHDYRADHYRYRNWFRALLVHNHEMEAHR